jgi:hypothetical protein
MKILMVKHFLVAITFCLTIVISNSSSVIATEKIEWTPNEIEVTLGNEQGSSDTVLASFTNDRALDQITLEVVPALSAFVTVDPSTIQNVQAGVPYVVALHFSLPLGTEPGDYEGVVHVTSGNRTLPQTLKIRVTVEAGSKVVLGTDLPPNSFAELAVISSQSLAQGFSLTSLVHVSAIKLQMAGFGVDQFTVWLTNSLGPGTSQANVLLQTSATFPNTGGGLNGSTVSIPVNLSLPPGNYFIVLGSNQSSVSQGWLVSTMTLPSTVGTVGVFQANFPTFTSFPPASVFFPIGLGLGPAAFQLIE